MMSNDWLQRPGGKRRGSDTAVLDALFDLPAREVRRILENVRDYDGTKVIVSCTEETDLESVLKLSLCLATVTIIVPAPLWVSCGGQTRYREFNYGSVGTNGWNSAGGVLQGISDLAVRVPRVFEDGVVTFLPVLGESLHRWSDPELDLPELPYPYSTAPRDYTTLDIRLEALYGLCSERLAAERLGAIHLNSSSFLSPVLNDFWIHSKIQPDNGKRGPVEVSIPGLNLLPVSDVFELRKEFAADFSLFTKALRDAFQPRPDSTQTAEQALEALRFTTAHLSRQLGSGLASKTAVKNDFGQERIFALGNNGGKLAHAINFLTAGGGFHDFINLITGNHRLKTHDSSLFAVTENRTAA
jgi:hypothetical protein